MNDLVQAGTNLPNGKRVKPSVKELKAFIDIELDWLVAAKKEFTAYAVTVLIRHKNPGLEIVHEDVRHYVHNKMDKYNTWSKLAWGYDSKTINYNGEDAQTYFPMLQTVIGSVAQSSQPTISITVDTAPKKDSKKSVISNPALPSPNQIKIDWGDD